MKIRISPGINGFTGENSVEHKLARQLSVSSVRAFANLKKQYGRFNFRKPVVFFGAGQMGILYINFCRKNGIKILAVCDNDKRKVGQRFADDFNVIVSEGIALI